MSAFRGAWRAGLLVLPLAACSSNDHATPGAVRAQSRAFEVVALVGRTPIVSSHLGRGVRLRDDGRGLVIDARFPVRAPQSQLAGNDRLDARLPRNSRGVLRVAAMGGEGVELLVESVDVKSVDVEIVEGATVALSALEDGDIAYVLEPLRVEELRVLRSAKSPTTARYTVTLGHGIADLRVRDGIVEAVDRLGRVRIQTEPLIAVDARGERRALTVRIDGEGQRRTLVAALDAVGMEWPIVVDPTWTTVASMLTKRQMFGARTLPNGKILIVGGRGADNAQLSTTELFDATTGSVVGKPLPSAISDVVMTGANGKLFAINHGCLSAYGYDIVGDVWDSAFTAPPSACVLGASGSLLADGRYLAAGGTVNGVNSAQTELFDPATGSWSLKAPLSAPRSLHMQAVLPNGHVLVAGGIVGGVRVSTTEEYDPGTNTWTAGTPMPMAQSAMSYVRLPSGRTLFVDGAAGTSLVSASYLYDPIAKTWLTARKPGLERVFTPLLALPSGRTLFVGGGYPTATSAAELYDETLDTWTVTVPLATPRWAFAAVKSTEGRWTLFGGSTGDAAGALSSVEVFAGELADGTACSGAAECAKGFCVDGVCCDTACTEACRACDVTGKVGTCSAVVAAPPHGARTCAPYLSCAATGGVCATTCATGSDCASGSYCEGTCKAKKANGAACALGSECTSASCVDGVCCNTACGDRCAACDIPGKVGVCSPVLAGAPHGTRTACVGTAVGTDCGFQCQGAIDTTSCHYPVTGAACGSFSCSAGVERHTSTCNGMGLCNDVPKACAPYGCGAVSCNSVCSTTADCGALHACKAGMCVPAAANGTTCATSVDCASGHCVDGLCCDAACDAQCAACDVSGKLGVCSTVAGKPHGARTACATPTDVCGARQCDGKDTATCAGFVSGTAVTCAPASCSGATSTGASSCDGAGACKAATPRPCAPYGCASGACKTSCATSADCDANGYECSAGSCVPRAPSTCSGDGAAMIVNGTEQACTPFRCVGERCKEVCSSSDDCSGGFVCEAASRQCVVAPASTDSGGCAMSRPRQGSGAESSTAWWLGLAVALAARRRRAAR